MNEYKPTPDVLSVMLRKAWEKLASARNNLDSGFYVKKTWPMPSGWSMHAVSISKSRLVNSSTRSETVS